MLGPDWRRAPVGPVRGAALVWLDALTLRPETLGSEDAAVARAAGLGDAALEQAAVVAAAFATMNRLVDAFGADLPEADLERNRLGLEAEGRLLGLTDLRRGRWSGGAASSAAGALRRALREGDGDAPLALRRGIDDAVRLRLGLAASETALPAPVRALVEAITVDARRVEDAHFDALRALGLSDEALYELVFTAAASAGLGRLERADQALRT